MPDLNTANPGPEPSTPALNTAAPRVAPATPSAVLRPAPRHWSWIWLLPLAALLLAVTLVVQAQSQRGRSVHIRFEDGNGIEVNDPLMYRGVQAGRVRAVSFSRDLNGVVVSVELRRDAGNLAVDGSQFWIVRPEVSLTRVSGLETLVGPRYVQVEPGPPSVQPRSEFTGLERPPTSLTGALKKRGEITGHLHVVVRSPRLGSVAVGSPVFFRDVKVGLVTDFTLEPGARMVDLSLRLEPQYAGLVRTNSEFWNAGGVGVDFGFTTGLSLRGGSLESVLTGGIAFATPSKAGTRVQPGHVFTLSAEQPKNWVDWSPDLSEISVTPPDSRGP